MSNRSNDHSIFGATMRVLTFLNRCTRQRPIAKAFSATPFVVEMALSAKQRLLSARVARYEAILVVGEHSKVGNVLTPVKLLGEGNSDASLFVFAR
jgi:hypothetical protein